jgi:hypothetical protein
VALDVPDWSNAAPVASFSGTLSAGASATIPVSGGGTFAASISSGSGAITFGLSADGLNFNLAPFYFASGARWQYGVPNAGAGGLFVVPLGGAVALMLTNGGPGAAVAYQGSMSAVSTPTYPQGQQAAAASLPVVLASNRTPALWEAPNQKPAQFALTLAIGATGSVVAGVGGQSIYLFEIELAPDAVGANFLDVSNTVDSPVLFAQAQLNQLTPRKWDFYGSQLPVGAGVQFRNDPASAGAIAVRGQMTYSQG